MLFSSSLIVRATSRLCSCADQLVCRSAVYEGHGYLGPDRINVAREVTTRFQLKDQWKWNNAQVQRFLSQNCSFHPWTERVPSPTVSWSSETLHNSQILVGLFFFLSLSKHDSQSKPTNLCVAHSPVLQGLHCFASVAIPKSRHRFVIPCVHFVYYSSVINYRSNNKSYKGNIYP